MQQVDFLKIMVKNYVLIKHCLLKQDIPLIYLVFCVKVREGIRKFNSTNRDKIIFGYSETISVFYLSMVNNAIKDSPADSLESFEEFLSRNPHLQDTSLPFSYYSKEVFLSEEAKRTFVPPDVKNFDNLLTKVAVE